MQLDLTKEIRDLVVLNGFARNFEGPLGFRMTAVSCLSRDNRAIDFADPTHINEYLKVCITQFSHQLSHAHDLMQTAQACAYFWMTFICIHPFMDGNGRTAKAYLEKKLEKTQHPVRNFDLLDRYLITGVVEQDLKKLTALFVLSLTSSGPASQAQSDVS